MLRTRMDSKLPFPFQVLGRPGFVKVSGFSCCRYEWWRMVKFWVPNCSISRGVILSPIKSSQPGVFLSDLQNRTWTGWLLLENHAARLASRHGVSAMITAQAKGFAIFQKLFQFSQISFDPQTASQLEARTHCHGKRGGSSWMMIDLYH